jgi:hypothetical protein
MLSVYQTSQQLERELSNALHIQRLLESELAEAIAQRDELLEAIERYLPFVPDMEPIGAAKHAEANLAAWNLRQTIAKLKGKIHDSL